MQVRWLGLSIFLFAGMLLCPAIAADTPLYWTKLMLEGKHLVRGGVSYLDAVTVAEKFGEEDPRLHLSLHAAAVDCVSPLHDYKKAESFFKRDIALLEKIDVDFPDLVSDCYELARLYEAEHRYKEAEALLLRAVAIRKKWEDVQSDDPFNADILGELCIVYNELGQTDKAIEAYAQMVENYKQLRTKASRAACYKSLSSEFRHYVTSHQKLPLQQKMHFLQIALEFSKAAIVNFKYPLDISNEQRSAGNICWELNDLKQSEEFYRESIDLAFDQIETLSDTASWNLTAIDKFLFAQHRDHEVEQLQSRYLKTVANTFGKASREYGNAVRTCADIWWEHKDYDKAAALKRQSESVLGSLSKR